MNILAKRSGLAIAIAGICLSAGVSQASSHREAPFITEIPKVDGTDFYMFRSYEAEREGFVTLIANYLPLQDAYGGPNYFDLDSDAIYEIHIDNDGDAVEDKTFQFKFSDMLNDIQLSVGPDGNQKMVSVPLKNIGDATDPTKVQFSQEYTVTVITGDRRTGTRQVATNVDNGTEKFSKPLDNIGVNPSVITRLTPMGSSTQLLFRGAIPTARYSWASVKKPSLSIWVKSLTWSIPTPWAPVMLKALVTWPTRTSRPLLWKFRPPV